MLALTAHFELEIEKMDVKIAFLHEFLNRDTYI